MNRHPRINIDGMPIARLRDLETRLDAAICNDIAHAIFHTEVRAYRTAILAGSHHDIEVTAENIRIAIARALMNNARPEPRYFDNDSCGNG